MTSITPLSIPEVLLITPKRHGDARGWFMETWSRRAFAEAGYDVEHASGNARLHRDPGQPDRGQR